MKLHVTLWARLSLAIAIAGCGAKRSGDEPEQGPVTKTRDAGMTGKARDGQFTRVRKPCFQPHARSWK